MLLVVSVFNDIVIKNLIITSVVDLGFYSMLFIQARKSGHRNIQEVFCAFHAKHKYLMFVRAFGVRHLCGSVFCALLEKKYISLNFCQK